MARNKRETDRQVKQNEIVQVAKTLFLSQGYEATTMAAIARNARVAPNTLYWYYRDKDDLLIGVLDGLLEDGFDRYAKLADKPLNDMVFWLLKELEQAGSLVATVHARLSESAALREWHSQFHALIDQLFAERLASRGTEDVDQRTDSMILSFVVEGLLSHSCDEIEQRRIIDRVLPASA